MTKAVLQTRMLGYATDRTGHVMAPQEIVYEVEAPAPRKVIPLRAKLWLLAGIAMWAYAIIQGAINTFG